MSNTSLPQIFIDPNVEVKIILRQVYYRPEGYYQTAEQLQQAAKSMGFNINIIDADKFIKKQVIWQKYSPRPIYIPCASYNRITIPNSVHQADLIYLTHDEINGKIYKYCLCICDVASRYKAVCALEDRSSKNVAEAFRDRYRNTLLNWPKVLQVDDGSEFKGEVRKLMESKNVKIRIGKTKKGQCIVERFNKTLAKKIYKIQDASDQLLPPPIRSRKFVRNLQKIVNSFNNTISRLIKIKLIEAIKMEKVEALPSQPALRPIGFKEKRLESMTPVRYLLENSEYEGGRRRATDPNWSNEIYYIEFAQVCEGQPVLYRLKKIPHRFFVREELLVIPHDSELPPVSVLEEERRFLE